MTDTRQPPTQEPAPARGGAGRRLRLLSAGGMLTAAGAIALAYLCLHLAGWREHISAVYATTGSDDGRAVMGLAYAASYFTFVLVAPILAIAAGIYAVGASVLSRRAA